MFRLTCFYRFTILFCFVFIAAAAAQTIRAQTPMTAEQYVEEGIKQTKDNQYDKAVESFKQAIKLNPNSAAAHHQLGSAYGKMGRVADALEPLKTAARLDPDNALTRLNLGITYGNLRRPDDAVAELNAAKQLSPKDARIYIEIGNVLHNASGRIEDALAMYLEARRLNPEISAVHHNIGLMQMRLGKFSEAVAPLQEALRLEPNYRNARYLLSDAYSKTGRYIEAAESWTKFLEIVPNGPEALTKRSWNYLYAGKHGREAAADARAYLKLYGWKDGTSPYLAVMANIGYRQAGMDDEAQAVIVEAAKKCLPDKFTYQFILYFKGELSGEELLKLATDNDKKTEVHAYLGMDLLLKGKTDEARTHFNWVKEYGNKRFFEYPLAVEELKRLG